jgi:hypothetical protein
MGDPNTEQNTQPELNTVRNFLWQTVISLSWASAFWGRRLVGSVGIVADALAEATQQAFYARLPGHPQQAPDSLGVSGADRSLFRFRGETLPNFAARIVEAWSDYDQAGTPQQMIRVLNQWGNAGWPDTWMDLAYGTNLQESTDPTQFTFTIIIPFGNIQPAWIPAIYGENTDTYGDGLLFYGLGPSTDIATLLYLVRQWKRASSLATVVVFYSATASTTFLVG